MKHENLKSDNQYVTKIHHTKETSFLSLLTVDYGEPSFKRILNDPSEQLKVKKTKEYNINNVVRQNVGYRKDNEEICRISFKDESHLGSLDISNRQSGIILSRWDIVTPRLYVLLYYICSYAYLKIKIKKQF